MARKIKGMKPELHPLDKTIYVLLIIFAVFGTFALLPLLELPAEKLCVEDESVVYYWVRGSFNMIPLFGFLFFGVTFYAGISLDKRLPLFKPVQFRDRTRIPTPDMRQRAKKHKMFSVVMLLLFAATAIIAAIPDVSRETMDEHGRVTVYSPKNEIKETYEISPQNVAAVEFRATVAGKHTSNDVIMTVTYNNGEKHFVYLKNFKDMEFAIEFMEEFKEQLGSDVEITSYDKKLHNVANVFDLTPSQEARLFELFNTNG